MMENARRRWDVDAAHVKIVTLEGKQSAIAAANMDKESMMLPPCIPKQCSVHDSSAEHPQAVPVSVALAVSTGDAVEPEKVAAAAAQPDSMTFTKRNFLLFPEFKLPTRSTQEAIKGE